MTMHIILYVGAAVCFGVVAHFVSKYMFPKQDKLTKASSLSIVITPKSCSNGTKRDPFTFTKQSSVDDVVLEMTVQSPKFKISVVDADTMLTE